MGGWVGGSGGGAQAAIPPPLPVALTRGLGGGFASPHTPGQPRRRLGRLTCSGKMKVLEKLLEQWQAQGRKVLVFSQTRVMLDVIERFVGLQGYTYCRLDGNTPIKSRIHLIDKFNTDPDIFVALLTAKVGGVGINLIGASRGIVVRRFSLVSFFESCVALQHVTCCVHPSIGFTMLCFSYVDAI